MMTWRIQGNRDLLVGVLQEKYGYSRAQATEELDRRLKELGSKGSNEPDRQFGVRP